MLKLTQRVTGRGVVARTMMRKLSSKPAAAAAAGAPLTIPIELISDTL